MAVGVLEVVLADQPTPLRRSAHILVAWYNLSRLAKVDAESVAALRAAALVLRDDWLETFQATGIKDLARIPKFHRLSHVAGSVQLFGPYLHLTTEASEAAHKRLKNMYRTYVLAHLRVCEVGFMYAVCICVLTTQIHAL